MSAKALDSRELRGTADMWASSVVARARETGTYLLTTRLPSGTVFQNPPLFQGTAGIGYQLLSMADPSRVPSVLSWA